MALRYYNQELQCALSAAALAGAAQLVMRKKMGTIIRKSDASPVTAVDKRCEAIIRDKLLRRFKRDSFLGEESGAQKGVSGRVWIVDPLDGTRPYIRGIPTHSVLIALLENNAPVVGVMYLPALSLTCWAAKGRGAFLNNKRIHVSTTKTLAAGMISSLGLMEKNRVSGEMALRRLVKKADYCYGFMDAYSYVCCASGALDAAVNLLDKPWDCAAAACIVQEAGGKFSDIAGKKSVYSGSIVLSNGLVHNEILQYFK